MATQGEKTFGTLAADLFNVGGQFQRSSSSGSTAGRSVSWQGLPNAQQEQLSAVAGPAAQAFLLPYVAQRAGFNPESFLPSSQGLPGYRYHPSDSGVSGSPGATGPLRFDQPGDTYGKFDFPGGEQGYNPVTGESFDPLQIPAMNAFDRSLQRANAAAPDYAKYPRLDPKTGFFDNQTKSVQNVLDRAAAMTNTSTPDGQFISTIQRMGPAVLPLVGEQTKRINRLPEELQQGAMADLNTALGAARGLIGGESFSQTTTQQQESKSSFGIGNIAKLAAIAAAPFTGGASLAALPVIGGIEGGGEGFLQGGLQAGASYAMGGGFSSSPTSYGWENAQNFGPMPR